jgi:hypothetical protein
MVKSRLTLEQHQDLGRKLAKHRDELQAHTVFLAGAYPRSGPEAVAARKLRAAYKAIDEARSALDSSLFREHPDEASPDVYYPAQRNRRREVNCTAEGIKHVGGEDLVVICNHKSHDGPDHHDVVHGDWTSPGGQQ